MLFLYYLTAYSLLPVGFHEFFGTAVGHFPVSSSELS